VPRPKLFLLTVVPLTIGIFSKYGTLRKPESQLEETVMAPFQTMIAHIQTYIQQLSLNAQHQVDRPSSEELPKCEISAENLNILTAIASKTFHLFSKLPIELRLIIWESACPDGRVLEVSFSYVQRPSMWLSPRESSPTPSSLLLANKEARQVYLSKWFPLLPSIPTHLFLSSTHRHLVERLTSVTYPLMSPNNLSLTSLTARQQSSHSQLIQENRVFQNNVLRGKNRNILERTALSAFL
jgi:hypothetical protein